MFKSYYVYKVLILLTFFTSNIFAQQTHRTMIPFESDENYSANYNEIITFYKAMAEQHVEIQLREAGPSDIGFPIHLVVISANPIDKVWAIDRKEKSILMINNGIHPGEPCGIDASMMLVRDLVASKQLRELLKNTIIILVPVYNISGSLNRTGFSRANQLGPKAYGFRGNIRHLDLNRDFIKSESRNAQTFNQIFAEWKPDMMIDNHTSNGADYQYTMTLIPTQKDKLEPSLKSLLTEELLPYLYEGMTSKEWDMTPYVYAKHTPDDGIYGFLDLARYSSGYAALHHCLAFMPETHMLKPYKDRVQTTYDFMLTGLEYLHNHGQELLLAKRSAVEHTMNSNTVDLNWKLDESKIEQQLFKGYEANYKKSLIHGQDRLFYDQNKPYEKNINFWNTYETSLSVKKPKAYVIPQAYSEVIQKLKNNGVIMHQLKEEIVYDVNMYYIKDYKTSPTAYEGCYLHSDIKVETKGRQRRFYKGDYMIYTGQAMDKYIIETLEPNGPDSFFAWGFFDGILMQKEYFSTYVFEDLAVEILEENQSLKKTFDQKKKDEEDFNQNPQAQLMYIYRHSKYYEDTHNLYPIARIEKSRLNIKEN